MAKKERVRSGEISPTETAPANKVKMRFTEAKFYNDLGKPMFEAGKIYELEGADWIQRWKNRGGEIVEGEEGAQYERSARPGPTGIVPPVSEGQHIQDEKNAIGTSDIDAQADEVAEKAGNLPTDETIVDSSDEEVDSEEVVDETEKKEKKNRFGARR